MDMHVIPPFLEIICLTASGFRSNKKAELARDYSFGSSAMLRRYKHPPLSAPFLRRVGFYRETIKLVYQ
jgi:hypothetical protein